MEWATLAALIAQYGIPFAEFLINKIQTKGEVTPEEWAELKQLASTNARSEMIERLQAAGIDPSSPQGQTFLTLVSPVAAAPAPVPTPTPDTPAVSETPQ